MLDFKRRVSILKENLEVCFLVMAGKSIGMGHATRVNALKSKLEQYNSELCCISPDMDVELDSVAYMCSSFLDFNNYFESLSVDVIVIDAPIELIQTDFLLRWRNNGVKILLINDSNEYILADCYDKMICCSITLNNFSIADSRMFCGTKYIMLRDAYLELSKYERLMQPKVKNVLLSFGGTDPGKITLLVLQMLKKHDFITDNIHVDIVLGKYAAIMENDIHQVMMHPNIKIYRDITDMAERLYRSDVAIISGGMTLYEACSLGTPIITINQNEEQELEAQYFSSNGASINLGIHTVSSEAAFYHAWNEILSYEKRKTLSYNSKKLIDSNGMNRVEGIIQSMLRE